MNNNHFEIINLLVEKAKNNDNVALEELIDFYKPLINASIRKCIYSEATLASHKDDLKSIANLEFIKLVHSYDVSRSFFSYYISNRLYASVSKSAKDLVLKNQNDQIAEILFSEMPLLWDPETTDPFGRVELQIIVRQALNLLKPQYKQCIDLIYYEQLSQEEACEKLGITQSAFSKRLKKSILQLKKILEDNFEFME
jgi:RNA polymerase sigma factor (sigma-70 family)